MSAFRNNLFQIGCDKFMKRKSILYALVICTSIICLIFIIFFINSYSDGNKNSSLSTTSIFANNNRMRSGYYLGEYGGKLATYSTSSNEPIEVFDVYVSSLPPNDVKKIREGIYASNEDDLHRLVEDFTS